MHTPPPLDSRELIEAPGIRELPGILADSLDRYDLMRAIRACDLAIEALQQTRAIHTSNLCRVANRLAFSEGGPA
jgi:hypothetical protein